MALDHLATANILKAQSLFLQLSAQSLGSLEVDIRGISILQALRLFKGLHFPSLESFSTNSLPHQALCGFLRRHTTIVDLTIGPCLQFPCALGTVASLPHLYSVKGSAKCISSLVSYRTTRVFSQWSSVQDQGHLQLFQDLRIANSFVTNFTLEYLPGDKKFMKLLVSTMARVSVLRLVEFPRVRREFCCLPSRVYANQHSFQATLTRGVYPWDARSWGAQFRALTTMMRFFLRTTDMLVKDPGNEAEEHDLIKTWTKDTGKKHEHLKEIHLWYGYGPEISYQSSWRRVHTMKTGWHWHRVSHIQTDERSIHTFF